MVPPLFLHFALVFPERPRSDGYTAMLARWLPAIYLPAAVLASTRMLALVRAGVDPEYFVRVIALLDTLELLHLDRVSRRRTGGAAFARSAACARSPRTRQLRWIVWGTTLGALPFALGYALPFALGVTPSLSMELLGDSARRSSRSRLPRPSSATA